MELIEKKDIILRINLLEKRINKLLEGIVDLGKITKKHKSGFCKYNPKINKYALGSPEGLAETIIFVIASQLVQWQKISALFPYLMEYLYDKDYIVDPRTGKYPNKEPYTEIIMGAKSKAIQEAWDRRSEHYDNIKNILDEDISEQMKIFQVFKYSVKNIRGLGMPKAGFLVQLILGRLGCFDSVNQKIYKLPDEIMLKVGTFDKNQDFNFNKPIWKPGSKEKTLLKNDRMLQEYIDFIEVVTEASDLVSSQLLWDRWTFIVADRVNEITKGDKTIVKYKGSEYDPGRYHNPNKKEVIDWLDKNKNLTGDDVTIQHHPEVLKGVKTIDDIKKELE
jgi:hypothetical protein